VSRLRGAAIYRWLAASLERRVGIVCERNALSPKLRSAADAAFALCLHFERYPNFLPNVTEMAEKGHFGLVM